MGDNKQIAPVVEHAPRQQIIGASIYCSPLMTQFCKYKFTENMRLRGATQSQLEYSKLLLEVGSGGRDHELEIEDYGTYVMGLHDQKVFTELSDAVDFIHPNGFDLDHITKVCILAATNVQVDQWNQRVQDLNSNQTHHLFSYDMFDEVDDQNGYLREMITPEILNHYSNSQVPAHDLTLKVDDICLLMRKVQKSRLANNTRCQIVHISAHLIRVKTLDSDNPIFANIPRFKFKVNLPYGKSFSMMRSQFPLRLAYAMTMNRSQGQEFKKVLVDLSIHAFSHGHLYVAISRIRNAADIAFYTSDSKSSAYADQGVLFTRNVVYDEILESFSNL
jgi:hypothetical protein